MIEDAIAKAHNTAEIAPLPIITDESEKHYGSCTFISTAVIKLISALIPSDCRDVVSIGSGLSLLEAFLDEANPSLRITCIEVESLSSERKYVPEKSMVYVPGTWSTSSLAEDVSIWLFLFPREPGLMKKYFKQYGPENGKVVRILWIGPREDAKMFKDAIQTVQFVRHEFGHDVLQPNETGLVWTRVDGADTPDDG